MKPQSIKSRVSEAQADVDAARTELADSLAVIRTRMRNHRAGVIIGAGLVSGFALSLLPTKLWARVGAVLGATGALVARSVLAPMIAGALIARENQANHDELETPPNVH
jgi:hypothetical protein